MNIIERAAKRLAQPRKGSLVEQAVDRLDREGGTAVGNGLFGANSPAQSEQTPDSGSSSPPQPPSPKKSKRVAVDIENLRAAGVLTWEDERSRLAEEFRMIKRPLLLKAFRRGPDAISNGHLIMVTSAKSGEGKSFMALSLAMSIATERDLTVLLVDADLTKPTLVSSLGIEAELGLVDVLERNDLDLSDVMLRTNRENLSVISSGRSHPQATELLASVRMARFIEDIAKHYPDRVIIFDAPPVLVTSEPTVLAMHVGQIVFVVEAGKTNEVEVNNALGLLSACKNIGVVLNKMNVKESENFGSYQEYLR